MAPKLQGARTRKQKSSDSKAAGKILKASQEAVNLQEKKKTLKDQMARIQAEKKKQERRARTLKKKAAKCDLTELMQMLMMKAFLFNKQTAAEGSGSASSTDAWIPKDADDALDKLKTLAGHSANPEVLEFAKTLTASKGALELEE